MKIFDTDFLIDQGNFLNPKVLDDMRYALPANQMSLRQSIHGGFAAVNVHDPLYERSLFLQSYIEKHNKKRMAQALAEGRSFAVELKQQPPEVARHAPKSEISNSARYQRMVMLAQGQAMFDALDSMKPYWEDEMKRDGTVLCHLFKPILGAFNGLPGARQFRRYLSDHGFKPDSELSHLYYAIDMMYDKFVRFTQSSS